MKLKSIEELKDGMWCRLASGEIHVSTKDSREYCGVHYTQALLDMGAEWYPKIPEGYRLATDELPYGASGAVWVDGALVCMNDGNGWVPANAISHHQRGYEYIVTEAKPQSVKQEPKAYKVLPGVGMPYILVGSDFQPCDRVTVRKVEG